MMKTINLLLISAGLLFLSYSGYAQSENLPDKEKNT